MMTEDQIKTALRERGLRLSHVAATLDVNKSQITRWVQGGVPAERVIAFERVTGISREKLRPDLWPPSDHRQPTEATGDAA